MTTTVKSLLQKIQVAQIPETEHLCKPCNNCYHIGWVDHTISSENIISYMGHLIYMDSKVSEPYNGYCLGCVDEFSIQKNIIVSIDTACNCRLNLCEKHLSEMAEQNK